jgi:hypothetical protein
MRMLCTSCWRTARPDTRIGGSDRAELLAWLCLAVPGVLYCYWRHASRAKVCPACGSAELVREARAARRRGGFERVAWGGGRLRSERALPWPRALGTPGARLAHGGFGALLFGAFSLERLLAALAPAGPAVAPLAAAAAAACALWMFYQALRVWRGRALAADCEAFDEDGRRLSIEALF